MEYNLRDENGAPHNSPEAINEFISTIPEENKELISDGYHTFQELYKHRIHLFIALLKSYHDCDRASFCLTEYTSIKSKKHFDGSEMAGWFIVQIETLRGQISYHLPNTYWEKCSFIKTVETANEWDGHTSDDVLERLLEL